MENAQSRLFYASFKEYTRLIKFCSKNPLDAENASLFDHLAQNQDLAKRYFVYATNWIKQSRHTCLHQLNGGVHYMDDEDPIPRDYTGKVKLIVYDADGIPTENHLYYPIRNAIRVSLAKKDGFNANPDFRLFSIIHSFSHTACLHSTYGTKNNQPGHTLTDVLHLFLDNPFSDLEEELISVLLKVLRDQLIEQNRVRLSRHLVSQEKRLQMLHTSSPIYDKIGESDKFYPYRTVESILSRAFEFCAVLQVFIELNIFKNSNLVQLAKDFIDDSCLMYHYADQTVKDNNYEPLELFFGYFNQTIVFNIAFATEEIWEQYPPDKIASLGSFLSSSQTSPLVKEIAHAYNIYQKYSNGKLAEELVTKHYAFEPAYEYLNEHLMQSFFNSL